MFFRPFRSAFAPARANGSIASRVGDHRRQILATERVVEHQAVDRPDAPAHGGQHRLERVGFERDRVVDRLLFAAFDAGAALRDFADGDAVLRAGGADRAFRARSRAASAAAEDCRWTALPAGRDRPPPEIAGPDRPRRATRTGPETLRRSTARTSAASRSANARNGALARPRSRRRAPRRDTRLRRR